MPHRLFQNNLFVYLTLRFGLFKAECYFGPRVEKLNPSPETLLVWIVLSVYFICFTGPRGPSGVLSPQRLECQ